jgi:hypothetical protein
MKRVLSTSAGLALGALVLTACSATAAAPAGTADAGITARGLGTSPVPRTW